MNSTAENASKYGIAASKKWWSAARELAISFDRQSLEDAIVAWIKLNKRVEVSNNTPSVDFYYALMNEAFLSLYDAETINPVYPVTDLGQKFIDEARGSTGIGIVNLPAPPEPTLTPQQKLELQVRDDWTKLPTKIIRQKMANDKNYRSVVERLAGELESSVTTYTAIGSA